MNKPFPQLPKTDIDSACEQAQEDIICFIESYGFLSHPEFLKDNLCQIVVDNFRRLKND